MNESKVRQAIGTLNGLYIGIALLLVGVWSQASTCTNCSLNFFSNMYFILAAIGAYFGYHRVRNATLPRDDKRVQSLRWFIGGLTLLSIGYIVWMGQNFIFHIEIPTLPDVFWIPSLLCWTIGFYQMYRSIRKDVIEEVSKLGFLLTFFWAGIVAVMFFFHKDTLTTSRTMESVLAFVIDSAYPMIGILNFFLILVLMGRIDSFDPRLRTVFYWFLFGTAVDVIADLSYAITKLTNPPLYYNGNWVDLFYATAMFVWARGFLIYPLSVEGS